MVLSEEESIIRDTVDSWINSAAPVSAFRRLRDTQPGAAFDPALLEDATQSGWMGICIPEELGGSGTRFATACLAIEAMGRQLVALPFATSGVVAAGFLGTLACSNDVVRNLLRGVCSGTSVVGLAVDEKAHHSPLSPDTTAFLLDEGYRLNGKKIAVAEGNVADTFLVTATIVGGDDPSSCLFLVPASAIGLSRRPRRLMDARDYADLELNDVLIPATSRMGGEPEIELLLDRAYIAVAHELYGLAAASFDLTLVYLKTRVQFGQTIGSFQALQHRAAEMYTRLRFVYPLLRAAAISVDNGDQNRSRLASGAKALAGELANRITREMVQMHGGIAMTDEFDAGLYLKRSRALENTFGSTAWHLQRYARLLNNHSGV